VKLEGDVNPMSTTCEMGSYENKPCIKDGAQLVSTVRAAFKAAHD